MRGKEIGKGLRGGTGLFDTCSCVKDDVKRINDLEIIKGRTAGTDWFWDWVWDWDFSVRIGSGSRFGIEHRLG